MAGAPSPSADLPWLSQVWPSSYSGSAGAWLPRPGFLGRFRVRCLEDEGQESWAGVPARLSGSRSQGRPPKEVEGSRGQEEGPQVQRPEHTFLVRMHVTTYPSPSRRVPRRGMLLCQVPAACAQVAAGAHARKAVAPRPLGPPSGGTESLGTSHLCRLPRPTHGLCTR